MKNVALYLVFFTFSFSLIAQKTEIWGSFANSNTDNLGSIFRIDSASKSATIAKTFRTSSSSGFELTKASDGNYYGLRSRYNNGSPIQVICRLDPTTNKFEEIKEFTFAGMYAEQTSGLVEVVTGELWGVASNTGLNDKGIVYKYNFVTDIYSVVFNLSTIGFDYPNGNLTVAPNGNVYGLARGIQMPFPYIGGVFEIDLVNNTITNRYRFSSNNLTGTFPAGQMIATNGKLYGICMLDGSFTGEGTLFEYNPTSHQVIKRATFTQSGTSGDLPTTGLFLANNGKIYGSTERGGLNNYGTFFEYTPGNYGVVKKVDLDSNSSRMVISHEDGNGRMIGFHSNQSPDLSGVIAYQPSSNTLTNLFAFNNVSTGVILKESANRYILGGNYVMEFDSLFNGNQIISISGRPVDGGDIEAPMVKGPDGMLYGYSNTYYEGPEFFRFDPVHEEITILKKHLKRDSVYNASGTMVLHPNNKFYLAFSFPANTWSPLPGAITRSGILEFDPLTGQSRVAYVFPNNMCEISSLVLDSINNFYGLSRRGDGTTYSRPSYLFKVSAALDSVEVLRSWGFSTSVFLSGDIMINDDIILATYNDHLNQGGYYKYLISSDSIKKYGMGSGSIRGGFVKGLNGESFVIQDQRIVKVNLNTNSNSTVVDFSNNPVAGSDPRNLSFHNNVLYGMNATGPVTPNSSAVFTIDLSATSNQLSLVHEFNNTLGRVSYSQSGPNINVLDVCRPSGKPTLLASQDSLCAGGQVTISVTSNNLNSATVWALYEDTLASPLLTDSNGVFQVIIDTTKNLFVKGEGSCFSNALFDSIKVIADSSFSISSTDSVHLCAGENFIRPFGDTIKNILSSFIDTSIIASQLTGCDSIVYSIVNVKTINTTVTRSGITLTVAEPNAAYRWINCRTNLEVPFQVYQTYNVSNNGMYFAEISKNGCVDSSQCFSFVRTPSPSITHTLNGDTTTFSNQLRIRSEGNINSFEGTLSYTEIFPNPTNNTVNIHSSFEFEILRITLFNSSGQLVKEQLFNNITDVEFEINGDSGIYFIQLTNEEGEQANFKVVKQ